MKKSLIAVALATSLMSGMAYSQLTVVSPSADTLSMIHIGYMVQEIASLKQQYDQLVDQVKTAKSQLSNGKEQLKNITGNYGMGSLQNSTQDLENRKWTASSWQDTLKGIAGGNADRYNKLLEEYKKNHVVVNDDQFRQFRSEDSTKSYQESVQTNEAVATIARDQFSKVDDYMTKLHELGAEVEKTKNKNTKSAIDLNTRVTQELGYIMIEVVRMQTALANLQAANQSKIIQTQSSSAKFFANK